ncbi:hypothetical protein MRX96_031272 [Rhipicephalus microplus]
MSSGPGGTLRMHRPNWLRFFVTQLVVLSWQPFPVRIERQPVGVLQDAGVPHPGPADTLNSDYSFHEDGRDGCMPAQTVCAESSARQAHLWWYGPRMDRTYYVLSATSILPSPLEKSIKPGETIAATSGPGGTLRMHRPNWLRFFVTQLVVLSWQPFPVRIERQPVGVLQDAGVPHPGPADTLNSDYSFHEDGRDGCMPAQTVCAESSARQAHLWWYGPRMDRTYYVLSATSILPSPLEKSIKPGETIAATSGPGGTLRMHRPNWLRFFVTQAPQTMQRVMRRTFDGLPRTAKYMDDVGQGATTVREVLDLLNEALRRVVINGLKMDLQKFQLIQDKVSFLGYVIFAEGRTLDESRVATVEKFEPNRNAKKLYSFLQFANHYESSYRSLQRSRTSYGTFWRRTFLSYGLTLMKQPSTP